MMPWNNARLMPLALPLIGQRLLRVWVRLVQVPLSLRAYLYEDAGEILEPRRTRRSAITILVPLATLLLTHSQVAFALLFGIAMGLFLCHTALDLTPERRNRSS